MALLLRRASFMRDRAEIAKRIRDICAGEALEIWSHVVTERPLLPLLIPLVLLAWALERWLVPFSNWAPLLVTVWATIQYGRYQRERLVDDLNKKWKRHILNTLPFTPLEPCEWLNKLLMEVWPNFLDPKLSKRFSSIVEKRLKLRKPKLIQKLDLQEFSLGSCPPIIGSQGTYWSTTGDQRIMHTGFDWDTDDVNIMFSAKLAKPLLGTARIVINSLHIKGDLRLAPILDGQAVLYSFATTPDVRIGVVFGSGGSQSLPATEFPGVSSWLVKVFTDTLVKTMVEPRRRCFSLPSVDLRKKAVAGLLSVTVVKASRLVRGGVKSGLCEKRPNSLGNHQSSGNGVDKILQTFVEVELGGLTRRTNVRQGSSPEWNATFNMVLHDEAGAVVFHLYEWSAGNVKYDYLSSCEIKMKYVADDSTTFWAIGPGSSVVAKHAEYCGKEVEMVVPFEGTDSGEITVRFVLNEWQFADAMKSLNGSSNFSSQSTYGSQYFQPTGRNLIVTVVEGRDLTGKDKSGKSEPYVKLQYGKVLSKTRTVSHGSYPVWNQKFEFDEIGDGEYLKVKCYNSDIFGDVGIGSARVNLEGLVEGSVRDIWVPLEKANTGELRLQIEASVFEYNDSQKGTTGSVSGWIELVLIEARDMIAADWRGTSDPYVRVQYGNIKKRTKVVQKTLNPQWNQILEFPDNGSPLILHVKDHNAVLPTSSIGECVVEYERLPPNQTSDKWIPLQGVKHGEIHVQITRKVPEILKSNSLNPEMSVLSKARLVCRQMRHMLGKCEGLADDGDLEGLSIALNEMASAHEEQEAYISQLEREKTMLLSKINEFDQAFNRLR
ncbi:extended synaptotagmin-1 isoform X1 [Amborella trichopoda]|uniref:C2 domain-containing protein n=1 Tax=Amborella trichopoda TaxID=13333 RepID=W1P297_AMBTC|nr:extended synaptotagmin-1 isoform X1 [Amborella trichopoda]ERN03977.1 hypothetical protein AMTR_s00079p00116430 [Amborella trichopoda]|eukprot:XP_006842302.1 extended synaptotagmin-1 isoform X1 [Amborella trichopoda]